MSNFFSKRRKISVEANKVDELTRCLPPKSNLKRMSDEENSKGPDDLKSEAPKTSASAPESVSVDPGLLRKALAAQKDDYLHLAADFENFKKRTRRDTEQQAAAEKESFIRDLLPVLDNLQRALTCGQSVSAEQLRQGVEMTLQQCDGLLRLHSIEAVEDIGQRFDPHRHEAVSLRCDPIHPDHSVVEVVQRGYRRGDELFRPAKVIVNDLSHLPEAARGP
jgi:molecular chaperone GrpE